jgi:hypothetical protein
MTPQPTIVHYDFASIRCSSFYITGFLANASPYNYRFILSRKLPSHLSAPVMTGEWRVFSDCLLLFRFKSAAEDCYFCIDVSDNCRAYHLPVLNIVKYYFKVNYDLDIIMCESSLSPHLHKIQPILPWFPLQTDNSLLRLPRLTPYRPMAWSYRSAIRRAIETLEIPRLETLRSLRSSGKLHDVFFLTTYYPGDFHANAMELRYKIMEQLDKQGFGQSGQSVYGFASRREIPKPFSKYAVNRYSLSSYMSNLARSRVAIYVRGLHDCISCKFGEYLALGLPVVGQTIANNRDSLLRFPYFVDQFAFDDPLDIVLEAVKMLGRSETRRELAESNARVFDTMLSPEAATADAVEGLGMRRCSL